MSWACCCSLGLAKPCLIVTYDQIAGEANETASRAAVCLKISVGAEATLRSIAAEVGKLRLMLHEAQQSEHGRDKYRHCVRQGLAGLAVV